MYTAEDSADSKPPDSLIDEVRRIRRGVVEAAGHDINRLCEQLAEVDREYEMRRGVFAAATPEAAARVVESWGADAHRTDDPIVDEVRAIRRRRRPTS
ncbi:MAG: hypothetical protein HOP29_11440 [Phycisphaerales bacterium]|nr:hypothetical protein [Phycisphaerales bacterium]